MIEAILGSALGGVFRLVPEVLKWSDRKNERVYEFKRMEQQLLIDKHRASMALDQTKVEGEIKLDLKELDALKSAVKGQTEMAIAAGGFMLKLSASVRPFLTYYWCVILYTAALTAQFILLREANSTLDSIILLWGPNEKAIVASIFTYWFIDRTLKK